MSQSTFHLLYTQLVWGERVLFWATALWPLVIAAWWPWWQQHWGRNIVSFDWCIAVVLLPGWLHITFGVGISNSAAWGWVEVIGVYLVLANIAWRTALIIRTQVRGARSDRAALEKRVQE